MANPTDGSKPIDTKKKKKTKPNLKIDGRKPNPWMVAKTEIRSGGT